MEKIIHSCLSLDLKPKGLYFILPHHLRLLVGQRFWFPSYTFYPMSYHSESHSITLVVLLVELKDWISLSVPTRHPCLRVIQYQWGSFLIRKLLLGKAQAFYLVGQESIPGLRIHPIGASIQNLKPLPTKKEGVRKGASKELLKEEGCCERVVFAKESLLLSCLVKVRGCQE